MRFTNIYIKNKKCRRTHFENPYENILICGFTLILVPVNIELSTSLVIFSLKFHVAWSLKT